ncbi:unnamed protein product, partial [Protopolystoma xenopodis]
HDYHGSGRRTRRPPRGRPDNELVQFATATTAKRDCTSSVHLVVEFFIFISKTPTSTTTSELKVRTRALGVPTQYKQLIEASSSIRLLRGPRTRAPFAIDARGFRPQLPAPPQPRTVVFLPARRGLDSARSLSDRDDRSQSGRPGVDQARAETACMWPDERPAGSDEPRREGRTGERSNKMRLESERHDCTDKLTSALPASPSLSLFFLLASASLPPFSLSRSLSFSLHLVPAFCVLGQFHFVPPTVMTKIAFCPSSVYLLLFTQSLATRWTIAKIGFSATFSVD